MNLLFFLPSLKLKAKRSKNLLPAIKKSRMQTQAFTVSDISKQN